MRTKLFFAMSVVCTTFVTGFPVTGCGDDDAGNVETPDTGTDSPITPPNDSGPYDTGTDAEGPAPIGKRASKSGTIAISDNDALIAMVNPEDGSISVFKTADDTRL